MQNPWYLNLLQLFNKRISVGIWFIIHHHLIWHLVDDIARRRSGLGYGAMFLRYISMYANVRKINAVFVSSPSFIVVRRHSVERNFYPAVYKWHTYYYIEFTVADPWPKIRSRDCPGNIFEIYINIVLLNLKNLVDVHATIG